MGLTLPAMIGARLARPDVPMVGIGGDGSTLMRLGELETAARCGVAFPLIVINDSALGTIKSRSVRAGCRTMRWICTRWTSPASPGRAVSAVSGWTLRKSFERARWLRTDRACRDGDRLPRGRCGLSEELWTDDRGARLISVMARLPLFHRVVFLRILHASAQAGTETERHFAEVELRDPGWIPVPAPTGRAACPAWRHPADAGGDRSLRILMGVGSQGLGGRSKAATLILFQALMVLNHDHFRRCELDLQLPDRPVADRVSFNDPLQPMERKTFAALDGPGCVRHIFLVAGAHPLMRTTRHVSRKMIIRIYFDDEPIPFVEAPIGDFFGVMHGQDWYPIDNHYLSIKAWNGYNCYFPMPFATSARIEIENGEERSHAYIQVDWERYPDRQMTEGRRFCARWRREMPTRRYGDDFLMLDADGPGQLLGYVYGVRLIDEVDRWSHGGSDNIYIDGDGECPSYLRGIGGEDTFGEGYGGALHPPETHHYAAMPYYVHEDVGEARVAQRVVGYRFFDQDRISFAKSLHIRFGCMRNDICSTVYWYQRKPVRPFFRMPDFAHLLPGTELPAGTCDLPLPGSDEWWLCGPFGNEDNAAMQTTLSAEMEVQPEQIFAGVHEEGSLWLSPGSRELGRDCTAGCGIRPAMGLSTSIMSSGRRPEASA